jgi:hypothetical protein
MKTYVAPEPTPVQIACNAIRDMFFHRQYNGVVPVKDIDHIDNSPRWHKIYGKKAIKQALKELQEEEYMNLDAKRENYLWGGAMHEMLFG